LAEISGGGFFGFGFWVILAISFDVEVSSAVMLRAGVVLLLVIDGDLGGRGGGGAAAVVGGLLPSIFSSSTTTTCLQCWVDGVKIGWPESVGQCRTPFQRIQPDVPSVLSRHTR